VLFFERKRHAVFFRKAMRWGVVISLAISVAHAGRIVRVLPPASSWLFPASGHQNPDASCLPHIFSGWVSINTCSFLVLEKLPKWDILLAPIVGAC